MKIIRSTEMQVKQFSEIGVGEVFCYDGGAVLYLKVSEGERNNCFDLDNDFLITTDEDEKVVVVEAALAVR